MKTSKKLYIKSGMTLVELMIVTGIILMLVVISIPVVKPMLASRKQADAAQTLSIYLNSARIRASETGRDCGVMFERYTDINTRGTAFPYNDSCLIVRQVETPPAYTGSISDVRVSVDIVPGSKGKVANIIFHQWEKYEYTDDFGVERVTWRWSGNSPKDASPAPYTGENPAWNNLVQRGDKIQFDNQGPYYTIVQESSFPGQPAGQRTGDNAYIQNAAETMPDRRCPMIAVQDKLPGDFAAGDSNVIRPIPRNSPVTFKLLRTPRSGDPQLTLTQPIGFPNGIIVDLQYSGVKPFGTSVHGPLTPPVDEWQDVGSNFRPESAADTNPVIIMFSPAGSVSLIRSGNPVQDMGPIHFLVGRWDRAAIDWDDSNGNTRIYDDSPYPPDDGLRNFEDMSNFWVTIDQRSGRVTTNPVASSEFVRDDGTVEKRSLDASRRFANEPN